ncbi:hypothetical protein [Clostridium estertheticum]|uniref:hypothetical protein n=1 Tax=Clostridium estertheticum TaxID=238834 RepID=UPI001CF13991|nr:hypothetical protein [Clostridium estertheticum]MCB2362192.1 hypothetical protein [Clostridium estertheticum]
MSKYNFIIWRELNRDINSFKTMLIYMIAILMQDYIYFRVNGNLMLYFNIPSNIFLIAVVGSVYSDLNHNIETMLSLPKNLKDILNGKSIYITIKVMVLSLLNIIGMFVYCQYIHIDMRFEMRSIVIGSTTMIILYVISFMVHSLGCLMGKKLQMLLFVATSGMIYLLNIIFMKTKSLVGLFAIILLLILLINIVTTSTLKTIKKEEIIQRSL